MARRGKEVTFQNPRQWIDVGNEDIIGRRRCAELKVSERGNGEKSAYPSSAVDDDLLNRNVSIAY